MSVESLLGGAADGLTGDSIALLNAFLTDTVTGSLVSGHVGGGQVFIGSGGTGELQGAVIPGTTPVAGSIDDGKLALDITLPTGFGFVFEGKSNLAPHDVGTLLQNVVDTFLGDPVAGSLAAAQKASLEHAISDVVGALGAAGANDVTVRVLDFVRADGAQSHGDVVFDAKGDGTEVFAIDLSRLAEGDHLVVKNVENVILAGAGSITVDGPDGVRVISDNASQHITGGAGNDTLIGGGGNDTLVGGAGSDVFGFSALGHFTIGDFDPTSDRIAFNVPGVRSLADLLPFISSVDETGQGVTFNFGTDASITLLGISASQLTADMLAFSY